MTNIKKWFKTIPEDFYFEDPTSERTKLYQDIKNNWDEKKTLRLSQYLFPEDMYKSSKEY